MKTRELPEDCVVDFRYAHLRARIVTIAVVRKKEGDGGEWIGISIRSPLDPYDEHHGQLIAIGRALAEMDGTAAARRQKRMPEISGWSAVWAHPGVTWPDAEHAEVQMP